MNEVLYTASLTARALSGADGVSKRAQNVRIASHGVAGHERGRYNRCPSKSLKTGVRGAQNGSNSSGPWHGWGFNPRVRVLLFDIVDMKEGMRGRRSPGCRHRMVSSFGSSQIAYLVYVALITRLCEEL